MLNEIMPQIDQVCYPNTLHYYDKSFILNEMKDFKFWPGHFIKHKPHTSEEC